ncbi:glycosyltransferase family 4 protein [Thiorhodovibrio litoralis]|uniref:glycosyltransferase family 4 protein n=1 Tax=Thiorhodovibrio litoralis TaxID=2952932 RepID=UPI002B25BA13|nr:glycosyltransferase family 4 protein [Thiorhodovibrio litoralis]WPL10448.1 Putative teichuronic acid biosynthesis glycosyltransferase TuaH [Thiorhodovibrio litoralis]
MQLLCLCKRCPQARDLFTQPYGRFYHIPRLLAARGYAVHLLLLSYQNEPNAFHQEVNLHSHSVSALPWGLLPYMIKAKHLMIEVQPDWVIGFSDSWYGILAQRLAGRFGARCLIDAYDNYESYIPWLVPLHSQWRKALRQADVVTAAGPQLADWMSQSAGDRPVDVVPMAADPLFFPRDKIMCRNSLGLPVDARLMGYSGSLHPNRGIELLFQVFERLRKHLPDLELVLSGRLSKGINIPFGVHWLGYRPAEEVPLILNSLDLLFVMNKPSAFGNFSYPVKLYEAMACGVPVVASDVPGTAWILRDRPKSLARAEDAEDFVKKALAILERGERGDILPSGWEGSAATFARLCEIN